MHMFRQFSPTPNPSPKMGEGRQSENWGMQARSACIPQFSVLFPTRGWWLAAILLALSISACSRAPATPLATPSPIVAETAAADAPATPTPLDEPTPTVTPTPVILPPTRYSLSVVMNYALHHLAVDEVIETYNPSSQTLEELPLMVEPMHYPGAFTLKGIALEDGTPIQDVRQDRARLYLRLPQPWKPGTRLALSLNYELTLPSPVPSAEVRPIPFGYTLRQTNLVDWFPFIPPYVPGKGWLAHEAGYFGEHLAYDLADFDVSLNLLDLRDDLIVAASAPAQVEGEWLRYEHEGARSFAFSVSPEYRVYTATVGSTTVLSYAFAFHEAAGQAVLNTTAEALGLYNELFGEYPRPLVSAVEADFLDGMEYDGLYFLSNGFYNLYQGTPGEYLIAIAAHETAHQWFYGLVGNDQALEPWLDEALCTYSERLFYERLHPEALDWWWQYRVNYYEPRGAVDGPIYNTAGYRAYRDAVYLNGAVFLEALREEMGDEAFFGFLKDYVGQMSGKIATREDFFRILEEHTQADLEPLMEAYFEGQ